MPADFFAQGEIQVFAKLRWLQDGWQYLGTAITSPQVSAKLVYRPIASERVDPGPYFSVFCTEQHRLSMVLNRINHRTWNRMKDVGNSTLGTGNDLVRTLHTGRIMNNEYDFELHFRFLLPFGGFGLPDGAPKGRLYYSCLLSDFEEDAPSRCQELGLLVECNPFPVPGQFSETGFTASRLLLYTERDSDFPNVTAE